MEHIHFKEKFTKKKCTGRQHQSSSCGMEEGGGGAQNKLAPPPSPSKFSIFFYP